MNEPKCKGVGLGKDHRLHNNRLTSRSWEASVLIELHLPCSLRTPTNLITNVSRLLIGCMTFADYRLNLGLNSPPVCINITQFSLKSAQVGLVKLLVMEWEYDFTLLL